MILYAVTISGHKYYFTGKLSEDSISMIDKYCDTLNGRKIAYDYKSAFSHLYSFICNELGCRIEIICMEHIFRINL